MYPGFPVLEREAGAGSGDVPAGAAHKYILMHFTPRAELATRELSSTEGADGETRTPTPEGTGT